MKIDDFIKEIKDFREKQLSEAGQPYIGIFYVIDDEVEWRGEHPRLIEPTGPLKLYLNQDHKNLWYQDLIKHNLMAKRVFAKIDNGKGREISYAFFPRGRVFCDSKNMNFEVICDKHIVNNEVIKAKLRNEMSLPFNTIFRVDVHAHYLCHKCSEELFQDPLIGLQVKLAY